MGPPLVQYEAIIPKGNSVFSYYGFTNPKAKRDMQVLEMSKDPLLSHFRFMDITKILPYSDTACPPDGICLDTTQTLIKMHMTQDTDMANKPKNFFQLLTPTNYTK